MTFIDVDLSSFEKVRDSLHEFQKDIAGFSSKISKDISPIFLSCKEKLKAQKAKVEQLQEDEKIIESRIIDLRDNQIPGKEKDIFYSRKEIERLEKLKKEEENRICQLENQRSLAIQSLQNSSNGVVVEIDTSGIDRQISSSRSEISHLNSKIEDEKKTLEEYEKDLKDLNELKKNEEIAFEQTKKALNSNKVKYENMHSAMYQIESSGNELTQKAKSMETNSSDIAIHSKSCVDECIQYLNDYLNS